MDFSTPGFGKMPPIASYGDGGFRVGGSHYPGSILILPAGIRSWDCEDAGALTPDALDPVIGEAAEIDVLLLGCGPVMVRVPEPLRERLRTAGVVIEPMATGSACRTYNVLIAEGRHAAAALIAVE